MVLGSVTPVNVPWIPVRATVLVTLVASAILRTVLGAKNFFMKWPLQLEAV
jgi:hypothetical protein